MKDNSIPLAAEITDKVITNQVNYWKYNLFGKNNQTNDPTIGIVRYFLTELNTDEGNE